jgi:hypothetical protein
MININVKDARERRFDHLEKQENKNGSNL